MPNDDFPDGWDKFYRVSGKTPDEEREASVRALGWIMVAFLLACGCAVVYWW